MFFSNSRYVNAGTYTVKRVGRTQVQVTKIPVPPRTVLARPHRRHESQRLDLIAAHYLSDPTAFWRLCDANNAVVPDALAAGELIGVPRLGE